MKTSRNNQFVWLTVTAAALMSFSFAAGYGLRALMWAARQGGISALAGGLSDNSERPFNGYPRVASRAGAASMVGHQQVFGEVISRLKELYVEPLPPSATLSSGAVEGLLTSLHDPNTRLLDAKEWSAVSDEQSGVFRGLGAVLTIRSHMREDDQGAKTLATQITVVAPMPGSPAEKAGLRPGDRITTIDNHWIAPTHLLKRTLNMFTEDADYSLDPQRLKVARENGLDEDAQKPPSPEEQKKNREANKLLSERWRGSLDLESAMDTLTGAADGEHTVVFERDGADKPITATVQLTRTTVPPVAKRKLAPTVGYLQVRQINAEAVRALDQALTEFKSGGVKSLVLDLRRSPGGSLAQTQEMASRFLSEGHVAVLEKRDSARKLVKKPLDVKPVPHRAHFASIAVLVDGGTAGAAEVLAAALRDAGLAKLVGAKTFGDGTEQTIFPLDNGAAISVTSAKMLSRKGTDFDGKGLKPDVDVAPSAGADKALDQALRLVRPS